MRKKVQPLKPFFEVGHKVQLKPRQGDFGKDFFEGLFSTVIRIQMCPDPNFFEDPNDWYRGRHWIQFWIKLDDFPGLDESVKRMELPFSYRELQPLSAKMSKQQLVQYCKERYLKEQSEYCQETYLGIMRFLEGEWPGWPLHTLNVSVPKGHYIDLINCFLSGAAKIHQLAQTIRENDNTNELARNELASRYEVQSQICYEIYHQLMPEKHTLALLA